MDWIKKAKENAKIELNKEIEKAKSRNILKEKTEELIKSHEMELRHILENYIPVLDNIFSDVINAGVISGKNEISTLIGFAYTDEWNTGQHPILFKKVWAVDDYNYTNFNLKAKFGGWLTITITPSCENDFLRFEYPSPTDIHKIIPENGEINIHICIRRDHNVAVGGKHCLLKTTEYGTKNVESAIKEMIGEIIQLEEIESLKQRKE